MKTVVSFALGCKVNQAESEAIAEAFADRGYNIKTINDKADIYVINTCSVTNFGDKKSRQILRKVKRLNPNSIVVAAGCYAQTNIEAISNIDEVDIIVGTNGKNNIVDYVENFILNPQKACFVNNIMNEHQFEPISLKKLANRTRVYIKIQDGCSQFCSYCIIPYARGPIRSRDEEDILNEIKTLSLNGFKEVVLTGIHIASYGKDNGKTSLLELVKKADAITNIERIRLSSLEPSIITDEFASDISKLKKLCPHFHLSLQSGCDKVLKSMNRRYTTQQYKNAVALLKKYIPNVALTTDIIVGFPGETDEDFAQTCLFAQNIQFSKIHVFPYSPKKGTPAAEMKNQISTDIKNTRACTLTNISEQMEYEFIKKQIGQTFYVLFEKYENGFCEGHTPNYIQVRVKHNKPIKNTILLVKIVDVCNNLAFGEIVS